MTDTLIINRPSMIPPHQRVLFGAITLAFWYLWLYLWLPLATLLGWTTGGLLGYHHMVTLEGYRDLVSLLGWYALVALGLGGGLIAWATYNLLRFRNKERRTPRPDTAVDAVASHFGVDAAALAGWQKTKVLTVHHNEHGLARLITPYGHAGYAA